MFGMKFDIVLKQFKHNIQIACENENDQMKGNTVALLTECVQNL